MGAEHTATCTVAMADHSSLDRQSLRPCRGEGEQVVRGSLLPAAVPFTEADNAGVVRLGLRPSAAPVVAPISMIWILIHRQSAVGWTGPSIIAF